jgi:hypothetical protein
MKQINKQVIQINDSKRLFNYAVLMMLIITQTSCFQHFYQTNSINKADTSVLKRLNEEKKYFIIHTPTEVFALKNIKVDSERISGERDYFGKKHEPYLEPEASTANQFPKKYAETVFSEVHLYIKDTVEQKENINIAINNVYQVDAYGPDKKADKRSKTVSIIGLAAVPVVAFGILAIAASSINLTGTQISIPF